ncbi:SH3 and multiple ankyrin repeat domains protein 1-like [Lineus longissimus]|uniref:SH3 and multiple ankyrin repeat domains protein 1-like n=1 Tax=Lineus longissimus TaxID=88925 RepID=UPI002B4F7701
MSVDEPSDNDETAEEPMEASEYDSSGEDDHTLDPASPLGDNPAPLFSLELAMPLVQEGPPDGDEPGGGANAEEAIETGPEDDDNDDDYIPSPQPSHASLSDYHSGTDDDERYAPVPPKRRRSGPSRFPIDLFASDNEDGDDEQAVVAHPQQAQPNLRRPQSPSPPRGQPALGDTDGEEADDEEVLDLGLGRDRAQQAQRGRGRVRMRGGQARGRGAAQAQPVPAAQAQPVPAAPAPVPVPNAPQVSAAVANAAQPRGRGRGRRQARGRGAAQAQPVPAAPAPVPAPNAPQVPAAVANAAQPRGRGRGQARAQGRRPRQRRAAAPAPPPWEWERTNAFQPKDFVFTGNEEILLLLPNDPTPLDFVSLYVTDDIIRLPIVETNIYADQYLTDNHDRIKDRSRSHQWKEVEMEEMKTFLAVLILQGIVYKPRLNMYWEKHPLFATPVFSECMSRDCFLLILKFLRPAL